MLRISRPLFVALPLFLGLALAGCTAKEGPQDAKTVSAISDCLSAKATSSRLTEMGEWLGLNKTVGLTRWEGLGCPSPVQFVTSEPLRQAVAKDLSEKLFNKPAFRQGLYASVGGTTLNAKQRAVLGTVGMFFDKAHFDAKQGVQCGQIEPVAAQLVSQLDFPLAIAAIGVQADIGDVPRAQSLAKNLLDRVGMLTEMPVAIDCKSSAGKEGFKAYAEDMQKFYKGNHPWAPGCRAEQDAEGFKLVCKGPSA